MGTPAEPAAVGGQEVATDDLARLRELAQSPSARHAVAAVREFLGMEVAYVSEITDREQVFATLEGDGSSFGVAEGAAMPVEDTYCHRILGGRLPNLIPDVRADQRAAAMPITEQAGVGAFVSVPVRFHDGRLYGTLCAASHSAQPSIGYRELQFLHVFARIIADGLERDAIQREAEKLRVQATAAHALAAAVQARDAYTADHSVGVVAYAGAVARRLGLGDEASLEVEQVALLHDIGKIAIPDAILRKPGPLNDDEWELMQTHSAEGEKLVRRAPGLEHMAPAIRAEHERWDGTGYPDGLRGDRIPIASRITFVCDAYEAMTTDRPYRKALSREQARAEIEAGSGTQFWPLGVEAFLAVLDEDGPA
jgi:response regulator RpfG family c-di-GMP phosphodiesterase